MEFANFEDKVRIINQELEKRRSKWQLKARCDIDFDDVKQIIRLHIWRKWSYWDQNKQLEPWLNTIISRQITNLLRNNYTAYSRPCLRCPANEGADLCRIYEKQCSKCSLYAKWERTKKRALDVKLPVSLDDQTLEFSSDTVDINYEEKIGVINEKMKKKLNAHQFLIYKMLFIEEKSEEEVAKRMGYKVSNEQRKNSRYKQIENHKKIFISKTKEIIVEEGLV